MKTTFMGYDLNSQIVAASSPVTESAAGLLACHEKGAGAAIIKTASSTRLAPEASGGGRHCLIDKTGFWAKSTFNREILPLEAGLALLKTFKRHKLHSPMPLIASITELDLDIEKWLAGCQALEAAGADALQLDLFYIENLLAAPAFETQFVSLLKEICNHITVPVMPKLNIGLPAEYAAFLLKKAGIRYVSLLDSIKSPAPLTFAPDGNPLVAKTLLGPGLSVFGGFMLPLTRQYTQTLCREGFKVCAGGGVKTAEDIAGLLFLGAQTVQIASECILHGFDRIKTLQDETDALFEKAGLDSAEMIREAGQGLYQNAAHSLQYRARWNSEKCAIRKRPGDCYHCAHNNGRRNGQSFCERIQSSLNGAAKAISIAEDCEGCGLCAQLCPHGAIDMAVQLYPSKEPQSHCPQCEAHNISPAAAV